jgi:hypothetical protein
MIGLPPSSVYRAIERGAIPVVQIPLSKTLVILAEDLDRFLTENRRVGPTPKASV